MFDIKEFEDNAKENGIRYWSAHEFMKNLGYDNWNTFKSVIQRAMTSCLQLGIDTEEVFIAFELEGIKSYKLTRFACFIVAMQADKKKPEVIKAQVSLAAIAEALVEEKINTLKRKWKNWTINLIKNRQ
jgi:DNA-damage-inducible protein D